MFYLNSTLDATAAQSSGLITKIIDGDFDKELMNNCTRIAEFSSQVSIDQSSIVSFLMHRDLYMRPL